MTIDFEKIATDTTGLNDVERAKAWLEDHVTEQVTATTLKGMDHIVEMCWALVGVSREQDIPVDVLVASAIQAAIMLHTAFVGADGVTNQQGERSFDPEHIAEAAFNHARACLAAYEAMMMGTVRDRSDPEGKARLQRVIDAGRLMLVKRGKL